MIITRQAMPGPEIELNPRAPGRSAWVIEMPISKRRKHRNVRAKKRNGKRR
jgi:hypothetical protein